MYQHLRLRIAQGLKSDVIRQQRIVIARPKYLLIRATLSSQETYENTQWRYILGASIVALGILKKKSSCEQSETKTFDKFLKELKTTLKDEQIVIDEDECRSRGKPEHSYHSLNTHPGLIVVPESTADVSVIMRLCSKYAIPVIPFGGGTSIEGQTLAPFGGVSIDFANMKSVLEINTKDLDCTVQAGLGYLDLNDILRKKGTGLWFPLDPGPGASIGGMCATRCSGSTAVRYGSMRENVLRVTAVLPDGTVLRTGSRARKCSAGYDLTRLLIGSEGTLAVITEATLKLHAIPAHKLALRVAFKDLLSASTMARDTLNCGVIIGRCELLDPEMVRIMNEANVGDDVWEEAPTLLYEITGHSEANVREQLNVMSGIAKAHSAVGMTVADDVDICASLWKRRKEALWAIMAAYPGREPMITDVCVPLSAMPALMEEFRADIDASVLPCPMLAHAGDGNIHVVIMFHPDKEDELQEAKRLANSFAERAIAKDGTCTGEHGVGTGKIQLVEKEMGPGSIDTMRGIKRSIDPLGIMNPGKVLNMGSSLSEEEQESVNYRRLHLHGKSVSRNQSLC